MYFENTVSHRFKGKSRQYRNGVIFLKNERVQLPRVTHIQRPPPTVRFAFSSGFRRDPGSKVSPVLYAIWSTTKLFERSLSFLSIKKKHNQSFGLHAYGAPHRRVAHDLLFKRLNLGYVTQYCGTCVLTWCHGRNSRNSPHSLGLFFTSNVDLHSPVPHCE